MIRLDNIVATYTTQRGQVNAVDGVTLEIPDSIVMGIAGGTLTLPDITAALSRWH